MFIAQTKIRETLFLSSILAFLIIISYPLETFSDGVDFLLGGYYLGISHPPSYPVYTQIVYLTKYLPIGNLAMRINLLSAIMSFIFLSLSYKFFKGKHLEKTISIIIILLSNTFLFNSINGELYIFNLSLIFLIFFLADKEDKRILYLTAFVIGLGLGVHHTIIFAGLYVMFKLILERKKIFLHDIILCLFFLIFGATVYLYLPLRAIKEPLWNWGNPKNLILFLNSFLRHDFQSEGFLRNLDTILQQIITFNPIYEFGVINGIILLISLPIMFYFDKNFFIKAFVFMMSFYLGFLLFVGNDHLTFEERVKTYGVFYLPAYVMLVYVFNNVLLKFKSKYKIIILLITMFGVGYNLNNYLKRELSYEKAVFPHDYGRMNLSMLPVNSTLLIQGGEKDFPIIYQQKLCKFREDVNIIQLNFLGKIWNIKESLKHGVAYKPFDDTENGDRKIIKSVILYQKEIEKKRVFTNIFKNEELPKIDWRVNGVYQEAFRGNNLDLLYFIRTRGKGGDESFTENILKVNGIDGEIK